MNYTIITETKKDLIDNSIINIEIIQKNGKLEINVNSNIDLELQKETFNLINSLV